MCLLEKKSFLLEYMYIPLQTRLAVKVSKQEVATLVLLVKKKRKKKKKKRRYVPSFLNPTTADPDQMIMILVFTSHLTIYVISRRSKGDNR